MNYTRFLYMVNVLGKGATERGKTDLPPEKSRAEAYPELLRQLAKAVTPPVRAEARTIKGPRQTLRIAPKEQ